MGFFKNVNKHDEITEKCNILDDKIYIDVLNGYLRIIDNRLMFRDIYSCEWSNIKHFNVSFKGCVHNNTIITLHLIPESHDLTSHLLSEDSGKNKHIEIFDIAKVYHSFNVLVNISITFPKGLVSNRSTSDVDNIKYFKRLEKSVSKQPPNYEYMKIIYNDENSKLEIDDIIDFGMIGNFVLIASKNMICILLPKYNT